MSDQYEQVRSLPFPTLAAALGLDMGNYRQRKHGQEYYGPCPIHNPKQNSTSFSYAADGRFNCFSCNAKGRGAIDLAKLVKNLGFKEAVELLGSVPAQTPAPNEKTAPSANSDATDGILKPLEKDTWRKFAVTCPWLEKRIPDAAIRERYGVFCYNNPARKSVYSGRVMIPIRDVQGTLYGYLGRNASDTDHSNTTPQTPKYLFPKNLPKSRFLFGAHELCRPDGPGSGHLPLKVLYLLESPFAVMKFASLRFPALAAFGWSVSEEQVDLLRSLAKGVVFLPDRNKSQECFPLLHKLCKHLWLRFPPLPAGIDDPEYLDRSQILAL